MVKIGCPDRRPGPPDTSENSRAPAPRRRVRRGSDSAAAASALFPTLHRGQPRLSVPFAREPQTRRSQRGHLEINGPIFWIGHPGSENYKTCSQRQGKKPEFTTFKLCSKNACGRAVPWGTHNFCWPSAARYRDWGSPLGSRGVRSRASSAASARGGRSKSDRLRRASRGDTPRAKIRKPLQIGARECFSSQSRSTGK